MIKKILKNALKEITKDTVTKETNTKGSVCKGSETKQIVTNKNIVVNESKGIKEVEYLTETSISVITTRGEKIKFQLDQISGDKQAFIEKLISTRDAYLADKESYQNKIDNYNNMFPNNGCTFIVAEKPVSSDSTWSGFYVKVTAIKPINDEISIPSICDVFQPEYKNLNASLKVKVDVNTKLKSAVDMFRKIKVKHLDLTQLDISCVGALAGMFHMNTSTTIDVSNWDLTKVPNNSISSVFRFLKAEEIIGLETWDTSSISNFAQVFLETEVNKLNISNWDVSNMKSEKTTSYGYPQSSLIFSRCKLGSIDLSNWDLSKVEYIQSWFLRSKIESVGDISKWNVSNAKSLDNLFKEAKFGNEVDLTKWKINSSCTTKDTFLRCSQTIIN